MQLDLKPCRKVPFYEELCNRPILRSIYRGEKDLSPDRMRFQHLFSISAVIAISDNELDTVVSGDITQKGEVASLTGRRAFHIHADGGKWLEQPEINRAICFDLYLISLFLKSGKKGQELILLEERFSPGNTEAFARIGRYFTGYFVTGHIGAPLPCIPGIAPCTIKIASGQPEKYGWVALGTALPLDTPENLNDLHA
jgi:hypothetical protein